MATKQSSNLRALEQVQGNFMQQIRGALVRKQPWNSIIDFVEHPDFLGFRTLYPRQKTLLKLIYLETENMTAYDVDVIDQWSQNFTGGKNSYGVQADVWDRVRFLKENGYRHFPFVQAVLGRRASKGAIGGILGAESIAHMISLDDPQEYYGIAANKEIELSVIATMLDQAKTKQFADIRERVINSKYLQPYIARNSENGLSLRTPQDVRRIAEMYKLGVPLDKEVASIQCQPYSSNSSGSRGGATFALFLDEFAHMLETEGSRSGTAVYNATKPSLDQFKKHQLLYCASSPLTQVGKFFELYTEGSMLMKDYLKRHPGMGTDPDQVMEGIEKKVADPEKLIIQLASWDLYKDWEKSGFSIPGAKLKNAIIEYDDSAKREEQNNPQMFKVERRGQFAEVVDGYLDPDMVDRIFDDYNGKRLQQIPYGLLTTRYHAHLDPGKSNANFAMAIGHAETSGDKNEFGDFIPHVVIDFMKVWEPSKFPNHTIDYEVVKDEIEAIVSKYRTLDTLTFDQWNSEGFKAYFNRLYQGSPRVGIEDATEKLNQQRYDYFKMAVNQRLVHSYKDEYFRHGQSLLEMELKFLTEKNGKVVKQESGPVQTKDLSDCVVIVANRIMSDYFAGYIRQRLGEQDLVATNLAAPDEDSYLPPSLASMSQRQPSGGKDFNILSSNRNYARTPAQGGRFVRR